MLLALTCALCTVHPSAETPALRLVEPRLSLQETDPPAAAPPIRLASSEELATTLSPRAPLPLAPMPDSGSGDGDHGDHSGHMSPMWILMGAMMVFMMVGMGVYFMNHESSAARPLQPTTLASPALLAVPVMARAGG
jgi:hypothetical protein